MKMNTYIKIPVVISLILLSIGCRSKGYLNDETNRFYKKTAYNLQHHSWYIPVLTMDSIYCVIENSHLHDIMEDKYQSINEYSNDTYKSLCNNGIVNVSISYKGYEDELTPIYHNLTIPGIEMTDISSIITICFNANGCLKEEYIKSKYEGLIIKTLFSHNVAVTTDCETGSIILDNESICPTLHKR